MEMKIIFVYLLMVFILILSFCAGFGAFLPIATDKLKTGVEWKVWLLARVHSGRLDYGLPKSRNNCHFTSKISLLFDLGVRLLAV